ncbi:uncharacterized protein LOC142237016 [Haematobia irritans]|uniref:uncharacterized protein LOC142237016 n=1 Tax=Haematobia irritans TaxID=7368 RepID=UPI003F4FAE97
MSSLLYPPKNFQIILIFLLILYTYRTEQGLQQAQFGNINDVNLKRSKRLLTYDDFGVVKLVLGTTFPIILADKMRSLNVFCNLQMQYTPPPVPLYWWSLYNTTTFAARKQRSIESLKQLDNSRQQIYEFMESIFDRKCLLKIICEISHIPMSEIDHLNGGNRMHVDEDFGRSIYHRLINEIFTPNMANVGQHYLDAKAAGSSGENCGKLYPQCEFVDELLNRYTIFE